MSVIIIITTCPAPLSVCVGLNMSAKNKPKANNASGHRRDNFTQSVIQILYKRAGGRCCRCAAPTFGPVSNNPLKSVNIGQAAHIAAAAPLGPRYDPKMTLEDRTSATNGMWMCSNCHDIIDRDVEEYPTSRLKKMKREAERRAKDEMGVGTPPVSIHTCISQRLCCLFTYLPLQESTPPTDHLSAGVSASTIVEIRKSKADILELNGSPIDQGQGEDFLSVVSFINPEIDSYLPEVCIELMAYFDQLVAYCNDQVVLLEVIRRLKILADTFHPQWSKRDVEQISQLSHAAMQGVRKRSRLYQSATALLKDLSMYGELKKKNLHTIPSDYLRGLRGSDLVDGDLDPPEAKRLCEDGTHGPPPPTAGDDDNQDDERYLELMEQLAACEDEREIERIESQLDEMGYEPNIV